LNVAPQCRRISARNLVPEKVAQSILHHFSRSQILSTRRQVTKVVAPNSSISENTRTRLSGTHISLSRSHPVLAFSVLPISLRLYKSTIHESCQCHILLAPHCATCFILGLLECSFMANYILTSGVFQLLPLSLFIRHPRCSKCDLHTRSCIISKKSNLPLAAYCLGSCLHVFFINCKASYSGSH